MRTNHSKESALAKGTNDLLIASNKGIIRIVLVLSDLGKFYTILETTLGWLTSNLSEEDLGFVMEFYKVL